MMPLIGNLSDVYGRKALLIVPVTASILPSGKVCLFFLQLLKRDENISTTKNYSISFDEEKELTTFSFTFG